MAQEIELKLALPEEAQRNFLRHPLLRQATGRQTHRLVNLYYDTPKLALRKQGIGLRLRAQGRQWLQTVKCAGRAAGGLSARPEWETPYTGHFDFSPIDDAKVRAWLERPKLKTAIAPIFETNFQRITWDLVPAAGTRIAVMLDRGWIAAAGHREAISEVELELLEGDATQLFTLANALAERLPVAPASASKADRGYRLFRQIPAAPVKAQPITLDPDDRPAHAFTLIALSCLDHLQQNHPGAVACDDPEYIHQMRVATRRLRAALRLFRPLLPPGLTETLKEPLRELMDVLGQARDFDVLLAEIAEPVLAALPDEPRLAALVGIITEQRFDRRHAAMAFLRSPRFGSLSLQVLAALHAHAESLEKVGAGGTAPAGSADLMGTAPDIPSLAEFAAQHLRRLRKKVVRLAADARSDDPATLHALRIGIKRLRYALEFFAPLAAPKAMGRVLGRLAGLQESLGRINDLANAGQLLTECAKDDPRLREAVTLIGGWHGPRYQKLLAGIPAGLKQLCKLRLPEFTA
jgi:adenylate cyclase